MVSSSFQACFLVALHLPLDWTPGWGTQLYSMGERPCPPRPQFPHLNCPWLKASFELWVGGDRGHQDLCFHTLGSKEIEGL